MLQKHRWRLILSFGNLGLAIAQSALGLHAVRVNPLRLHDLILVIPTQQVISYCINAPAFIISNLVLNIGFWRVFFANHLLVFFKVSVLFYVLLFLFWWYVGWELDTRHDMRNGATGVTPIYGNILGTAVSLGLLCSGVYLLATALPTLHFAGGSAIPVSTVLWGCGSLYYFVRNLQTALAAVLRPI